ncbi:MAG: ribbon-helix-helix protein, CopG family [Spirochaetaceae bacterium]|nr:MAG: ribbon-helix-helix protein, CopG family [Spirochaetaceae bacterium]
MLAVRLDRETEDKLNRLAHETGRSKSYYVRQAVQDYLEEREDYLLALAVLERDEPRKHVADLREELGLER